MSSPKSTVDTHEIERFSKDADRWWDENGPFKPLHRLNPVRMGFIKSQICEHFGRDVMALDALKGLNVLDIGCGGGLVCEPLARLGGKVTGADADTVAVDVARAHAANAGLDITYTKKSAEAITQKFDVVLALEIIEHVSDQAAFVESVASLCRPNGMVIFSTLNRTAKSYALGIIAAEQILGWVPRGTHSWRKFVRPSELTKLARAQKLKPVAMNGLIFNPLKNAFALSKRDVNVNYIMSFTDQARKGR